MVGITTIFTGGMVLTTTTTTTPIVRIRLEDTISEAVTTTVVVVQMEGVTPTEGITARARLALLRVHREAL